MTNGGESPPRHLYVNGLTNKAREETRPEKDELKETVSNAQSNTRVQSDKMTEQYW